MIDLGEVIITGRKWKRTFSIEMTPLYNVDTGVAEGVRVTATRETIVVAPGAPAGPVERRHLVLKWSEMPASVRKAIQDLEAYIDTKDVDQPLQFP